ncbi:hypothetical protein H5395_18225, partial [Paracoccus sp. MC1854]|uniref:WcbI family polysaccharide biosynthesis putative acetyltransferase n=1 Tax=Paracoccus sp. MC1854 TaxID=2760306 RepID=UPI0017FC57E1
LFLDHPDDLRLGEAAFPHRLCSFSGGRLYITARKLPGGRSAGGKAAATLISWPSLYFSGYNPELFYLKNECGAPVNDTFDYHILPVFKEYASGESVEACISSYQNRDPGNALRVDKAISLLEQKERNLPVKTSDFIMDNFRSEKLFHTFNHPASKGLLHVAGQMLDSLGISNDLPTTLRFEALASTTCPITSIVREHLSLRFEDSASVLIKGVEQSLLFDVRSY